MMARETGKREGESEEKEKERVRWRERPDDRQDEEIER